MPRSPSLVALSALAACALASCVSAVPPGTAPARGFGAAESGAAFGHAEFSTAKQADGPAPDDEIERVRVEVLRTMPQRGPDDALVTVVVFSDFQCPFCARLEPTLARLVEAYGSDLRIVWRDYPLPFHVDAIPAAEAAREAYAQRGDAGFWAMHDLIFANQTALERVDLDEYATRVGLDAARYARAMDRGTHRDAIDADTAAGARAGVTGTPSLFVNGRPVVGAQPYDVFETIVDDELARGRAAVSAGTRRARYYATLMRRASATPAAAAAPAPSARRPTPDPAAVYRVPVGASDAVRGPASALVTIVVFSDFECPFCSRVRPTLDRILSTYGDDVRLVFRHNPLPFHVNAMPAALASREAFRQLGSAGFFRMHDLLFENQETLEREDLLGFAGELGLDMAAFRAALDEPDGGALHRLIEADQTLARELGATGTPSFFINGRSLRGAQPYESFAALIDEELLRARALVTAGTPRSRVYEVAIEGGATAPVFLPVPEGGTDAPDAPDRVYAIPVPASAPTRGPASAEVTIQIFSDFQCPFCARVNPTLDAVVARYGDRVRLVWRNYPLPFHVNAMPAAEAAMEAFAQRGNAGFWDMHTLLFDNQADLSRETLERLADDAGLDLRRFRRALDRHTHAAEIEADMAAIRTAGAEIGTPSFFIDGHLVEGAQPIEEFVRVIDAALSAD